MEFPRDELERLMQYEKTRIDAQAEYRRNPENIEVSFFEGLLRGQSQVALTGYIYFFQHLT